MASQRRLKKLSLHFVKDVPLPNFSEALVKFNSMTHLELSNIELKKINSVILFDLTAQLTVLKLDRIDLTNQNVASILKKNSSYLRTIALSQL